jgi:hypothetical protein
MLYGMLAGMKCAGDVNINTHRGRVKQAASLQCLISRAMTAAGDAGMTLYGMVLAASSVIGACVHDDHGKRQPLVCQPGLPGRDVLL